MSEPRRKIGPEIWDQVKVGYASGLGLREIGRNMQLSENTVLARARREKWTTQIQIAKQSAEALHSTALSPMHSAATTMQQRAERHVERMAGITEKMLPFLETMAPGDIFNGARNLERFDFVARRNLGLENQPAPGGSLNLNLLLGQAIVQVSRSVDE